MRLLAGFLLALWLIGGLVLTLQAAHPLPGQVVDDNLVPFHTLAIYWRNLGSEFWMRNLFGNLACCSPWACSAPSPCPPWTDGGASPSSRSSTRSPSS